MGAHDFSQRLEELTEAVYEAAFDGRAWGAVMHGMHAAFGSTAETFYLLDPLHSRMREVHLAGVSPSWAACFDAAYFAPDNPWMQLSERLHQPGVVRTNERLAHLTRDHGVLYRSQYYNDWMRPQDFRYSLGNTLVREPGLIANVTLLRPGDMPTFTLDEVGAFERLSRHMTRALRAGLLVEERAEKRSLQMLGHLRQAALLLDPAGCILYANETAERLLRERDALASYRGCLVAADMRDQQALAAMLAAAGRTAHGEGEESDDGAVSIMMRRSPGRSGRPPFMLSVLPWPQDMAGYRFAQRALLVLLAEKQSVQPASAALLGECFGLTAAEARIAHALAAGQTLRAAAAQSGISYGTARGYLKILFHKTATHRQAELVRCLLAMSPPF